MKEADYLVGEDNPYQHHVLPQVNLNYIYASTIQEHTDDGPEATWCVSFAYRPNKYRMSKPGTWIKEVVDELATGEKKTTDEDDFDIDEEEAPSISTSSWRNMFATVNAHYVRVYHVERGAEPELLVAFRDPENDSEKSETFFTCTWTYNADGKKRWWVIAAGEYGVIRVLDVFEKRVVRTLIGHGSSVNDLVVHQNDPALLLSASKDESIRMWNLRTGAAIAVFAGVKGHRGEVIALDFNRDGRIFVSSGIDYSIRVWNIADDSDLIDAIAKSHEIAKPGTDDTYFYWDNKERVKRRMKTITRMFPVFITRKLHKNYVDCIVGGTYSIQRQGKFELT